MCTEIEKERRGLVPLSPFPKDLQRNWVKRVIVVRRHEIMDRHQGKSPKATLPFRVRCPEINAIMVL